MKDYLDSQSCPTAQPQLEAMSEQTRILHEAIGDSVHLHPQDPSIVADLTSSSAIIKWQEAKGAAHFMEDQCWSELPPLYGRYGTTLTSQLIVKVKKLESAKAALVTDCGMQALAIVIDAAVPPSGHAILFGEVYNKTKTYLSRVCERIGGRLSIVPEGDLDGLRNALTPETSLVLCETFTNPLLGAKDIPQVQSIVKGVATKALLVVDSTIATPWGFKRPLLEMGADVVASSGTKALGGQDRDLWGYIATNNIGFSNQCMDLLAMRGGILDWRRASAILEGLPEAESRHRQRCANAEQIAAFLEAHPKVEAVFHPSLASHPDAEIIARDFALSSGLLSFKVKGASEEETQRLCDAIASCVCIRYAASFDGLVTKVNHHKSVSEYYTPNATLQKQGIDRIIRLGIGIESPQDIMSVLNWALWHGAAS